jgi:hypothetical protein
MEIDLVKQNTEIALNKGKKWTDEEDALLLSELKLNNNFGLIAINHKRTTSSISARTRKLIYDMYLKNISIDEITQITNLNSSYINEAIEQETMYSSNKVTKNKFKPTNELNDIKKDIDELKQSIKDLTHLVKGLYIYNKPS